jgi:hypothetical protein
MAVTIGGQAATVETLLAPDSPRTRVYEAKMGITREWAARLVELGLSPDLPLAYDRVSGAVTARLGELSDAPAGTVRETFRFALNDAAAADNRIPPWAYRRSAAVERNAAPVPASLFGDPPADGVYRHWDEVVLEPPTGAARATIRLLYQSTSWEYVRFLLEAGEGASDFLDQEAERFLAAWRAAGMAEPFVMAEAEWRAPGVPGAIFADGFDAGNACAWSAWTGGALCP